MRSDHAGACFVRVGPRRFGSILGSILESFWEPSSPLYSFLVARVTKTGSQKRGKTKRKTREILGAGRGGGVTLRGTCSPAPAFSDIWGRNRGFRYRGVAFSGFPEYLRR